MANIPKPIRRLIKKTEEIERKYGRKEVSIPKGLNPGLRNTKTLPADFIRKCLREEVSSTFYPTAKQKKIKKQMATVKDPLAQSKLFYN